MLNSQRIEPSILICEIPVLLNERRYPLEQLEDDVPKSFCGKLCLSDPVKLNSNWAQEVSDTGDLVSISVKSNKL